MDQSLVASVVGAVDRVNRLVTVRGIGGVYYGEVGDVVVGRITKVMQKRWKVDINSRLDGILLLSSINLPTGELVRMSKIKMIIVFSRCFQVIKCKLSFYYVIKLHVYVFVCPTEEAISRR